MKFMIPWVLAAALAVAAWLLYTSGAAKDRELNELRSQAVAWEQLRAENEALKRQPSPVGESARSRKDGDDLMRLRNEVRQLRAQARDMTNQLQTMQRTQEQGRLQLAAENAAQSEDSEQRFAIVRQLRLAQEHIGVCENNLRALDFAKQQWATDHGKSAGAIPTSADLQPYLPQVFPACPAGGVYTWNATGVPPTCTIPGHALYEK